MTVIPIDSLYGRYPLTFRRVCRGEPFTAWGFECDDGWAGILAMFGEAAEPICAADPTYCVVDDLYGLGLGYVHQLVGQVKEKFGGLRLYEGSFGWGPGGALGDRYTALRGVVEECERLAWRTCEVCGEPGQRRTGGWIKTLCDQHAADRGKIGM